MKRPRHKILHQLAGLRELLQNDQSRFASAPILLLQSRPAVRDGGHNNSSKTVEAACRNVEFLVTQQLGFQTIVSSAQQETIGGDLDRFPTLLEARQKRDLARRVGAETVICVGCGGAMDLGKAMRALEAGDASERSKSKFHSWIFVPATYPACIAASASHALLLDPAEEALDVCPSRASPPKSDDEQVDTNIVALESKYVDSGHGRDMALFASLAVGLDAVYQGRHDKAATAMLEDALTALEDDESDPKQQHELIQQATLSTGELLSFGITSSAAPRSIPLALAAALMPRFFSHHDLLSVMASFAPALCELVKDADNDDDWVTRIQAHLHKMPRIVTSETADTLLETVHESRALWQCWDVDDGVLRRTLEDHVLL